MARFMLDDGIHDDERVGQLPDAGFKLFVRMISLAERRSGVGRARASFLRSKAFPHDDEKTSAQVEALLAQIGALKLALFWTRNGESFYILPRYRKHLGYIKDLPKRVLPLPPRELLADYPDTLDVLAPEYEADEAAAARVAARATPGAPPDVPRGSPGEAPAEERKGEVRKGEERRGDARGNPGALPAESPPPPPLASLSEEDKAAVAALTGKAQRAAARAPASAVGRLADRARETIIPRGAAPLVPDDAEVAAWEQILAREPEVEWDRWWIPRLCELMRDVAASEKHGPGGSYVITGPKDLLRKSAPKDPTSTKLVLDEMLGKFPTRLEPPHKRQARERAAWIAERINELTHEKYTEVGRLRLKTSEEREITQRAEREWNERQRAGPAPPGAPAPAGSTDSSTGSTSSTEDRSRDQA